MNGADAGTGNAPGGANNGARERAVVSPDSTPALPDHVRLHHDQARDRWVLLAPERLLEPSEPALDTLRMCDGKTTVQDISNRLGKAYNAPVEQILGDILMMLQDLADKDFLRV